MNRLISCWVSLEVSVPALTGLSLPTRQRPNERPSAPTNRPFEAEFGAGFTSIYEDCNPPRPQDKARDTNERELSVGGVALGSVS